MIKELNRTEVDIMDGFDEFDNIEIEDEMDTEIDFEEMQLDELCEYREELLEESIELEDESNDITELSGERIDTLEGLEVEDLYLKERTLNEIDTMLSMLDFVEIDENVEQIAGLHKDIKGEVEDFDSHHIPARSVLDKDGDELPTIGLERLDHRITDSYGGRMNSKFVSIFPDSIDEDCTYKELIVEMIDRGEFAEVMRNEIFELKSKLGNKYDGAIREFLNVYRDYVKEYGVPKSKK